MVGLDFKMLGPVQVLKQGSQLDLGSRKQRALLALLLVNRRQVVSVGAIVMGLWGADAPKARRNDVYVYMSRLRKALGGEPGEATVLLRREAGGYAIDVPEDAVDAGRFMGLLEEGRRLHHADPSAASLVLSEALALWEGDALQEFAADDFAATEITRLEEARLAAIELRIRCDMAWKDTDELIPEIQALVRRFPLRPELTASLMVTLYRQGRQAEALQAYQRLAHALGELGLGPPEELRRLEERILLDRDVRPKDVAPMVRTAIPEPIAAFIGRDAELADLAELVETHRLVTITGAGGLGKTAIAAELGRRVAMRYEDAVLIDLTEAESSGDVMGALAGELRCALDGRDATDAVLARLGKRRVLFILDNCEPVRAEAANVAVRLLGSAPGLRILATSRAVLGVDGERAYDLAPLDVGDDGDAQRLLADRIELLGNGVASALTDTDLRTLAGRTAGFPLLIELVAAQLRTFSAVQVIAAVDESLDALVASDRIGPDRHRDLRANISWSERFLPPEAAALLRRLAVFRSSFSLEAVAPVAGFAPLESGTVRSELRRLVDASLLVVDRGASPTRFRMLEPVQYYARGRLDEEGEAAVVAERHSGYYAELFASSGTEVMAGNGIDALRRDAANLEAAIRHMLKTGEVEGAQRAAADAISFWNAAESNRAAVPLIEHVLAADTTPSKLRARLLHLASPRIALVRGRDWMHGEMLNELRASADALRDPAVDAWVLRREADAVPAVAPREEIIAAYEAAIAATMDTGQPVEALMCLHNYAWTLYWLGANNRNAAERAVHLDAAEVVVGRYAELAETMGFVRDVVFADMVRAWTAVSRGQHHLAETLSAHAADGLRSLGEHRLAATMSQPLAFSAFAQGDPGRTLRHLHTAIDALDDLGMPVFGANWRFFRALVLTDLGRADDAVAELCDACPMVGGFVDADVSQGALPMLGRALVRVDPQQAVVVLACAEQHAGRGMAWPILPDWDVRNGAPLTTLRRELDAAVYEEAAERGAGMEPSSVFAETAQLLADVMPPGSSRSPETG